QIEGVDDAQVLSKRVMELMDGRTLIPLNVYLRKPEESEGNVLGVHVKETITSKDKFGGVD
ncbi:unnamed protein product, partial [marine sediment metagenome]